MTFHRKFLTAAALSVACLAAQPAMSQDDLTADSVIASVNGTDITVGHVIALRSNLPPHYDQLDNQVLLDGILNQLVQHELLSQSLKNGPSRQSALTIENESRAIRASEATDIVISEEITEAQVQAEYEKEYLQIEPETEYNAAHILVETKAEADDLVTKLATGADFAELAREFSTGPSGPNGGELGWFGKGVMVEPFFDAVVALKDGDVSEPVETQFGFHVIKLLESRAQDRPTLDEVREQLLEHLREEAFNDHIAELEKSGNVTRADANTINADIINKIELLE